ncbi:hypothetical protein BHE74_00037043 [Ensete ventricosum]|nr:hypothetical protein BHE74_00037043 [Ensete ventricosum]
MGSVVGSCVVGEWSALHGSASVRPTKRPSSGGLVCVPDKAPPTAKLAYEGRDPDQDSKGLMGRWHSPVAQAGRANPLPSCSPAYTCSKHAMVELMRTAATELGKHGVRLNCVSPHGVGDAADDQLVWGGCGDVRGDDREDGQPQRGEAESGGRDGGGGVLGQ